MTATTLIPDGYYAVNWNGTLRFYRLRTSPDGRWEGRQWCNRFRSDHADRVGPAEETAVRAAILGATEQAAAAFSAKIGVCYICGRTLTDATSRAYGIGPVCRGSGWSEATAIGIEDAEAPTAVAVIPASPAPTATSQPRVPAPVQAGPAGTLTVEGAKATLVSSYNPAAVTAVQGIPGRRWDGARKVNTFPVNGATAPMLAALCKRFNYTVEGDGLPDVEVIVAASEANAESSRAVDADIPEASLNLGGELMPFQRAGVSYAATNGSVLIGDEMGLGKTVQALATLALRDAFPALVVVPAVVKLNWERETEKWLPGRSVQILSGRTASPTTADIVIVNYDILSFWKASLAERGFKALIADESHYAKNAKAARTKALKALAKGIDLKILLTGTAVLNRPVELISQLDILGRLEEFGGFWGFARRYCGAFRNSYGWDFSGSSNLPELHEKLRSSCYVRRTKEQVLTELPAKRRVSVPLELTDRAKYERVEKNLREWFQDQVGRDAEFQSLLADLDPNDAATAEAAEVGKRERRARQAEVLTRINALRQEATRQKLDAAIAWVEDFLESGKKLVLFGHHREFVGALAVAFGADSITGDTPMEKRQAAVDRFQSDPESRLLVLNIAAGGVGITLTAASDVAFIELPWRPGDLDQAEDRCHRIGQEDSVTAWYLLGADTIDEMMAELIDEKRGVVEATLDGRDAASTSIMAGLVTAIGRAA